MWLFLLRPGHLVEHACSYTGHDFSPHPDLGELSSSVSLVPVLDLTVNLAHLRAMERKTHDEKQKQSHNCQHTPQTQQTIHSQVALLPELSNLKRIHPL
jgi:hypothetical protein